MGRITNRTGRRPVSRVETPKPRSLAHTIALALVALTIGSGAVVLSEPAPVDALTMGLAVLLPVIGLVSIRPQLVGFLSLWLVLAACGFFAAIQATDATGATIHTAVSLYLYLAAFTFAAFVARNPAQHTRLILDSYQVAALLAASAAVIGYLDLVPGAADLFTKYGRACGPFKDPNVFGAFLVLAVVYQLHLALTTRRAVSLLNLGGLAVLSFALMISFSRGAWAASVLALALHGGLVLVTAERNRERVKLIGLGIAGAAGAVLVVAFALQSDGIAKLMEERATLTQSYDEGPDGRFGGQEKAQDVILDSPFGIGAREFSSQYHSEDVHNVYLSMFLNAGWIGGLVYVLLAGMTLYLGAHHAFRRTASQPLYIVAYAALAATLVLGLLIDTDHWRHFYLLMGLVWGLMAGDTRLVRGRRILADHRPVLMRPVIVLPPQRRRGRIAGPARRPRRPGPSMPRRPARIVGAR